jgi:hypothetical protein
LDVTEGRTVFSAVPDDVALVDVSVVGVIGVPTGTVIAELWFVKFVGVVADVVVVDVMMPGADCATVPLKPALVDVPVANVGVLGLAVAVVLVPVPVVVLVPLVVDEPVLVLVPLVVVDAVVVPGDADAAGAAEPAAVGEELGAAKPRRFGGGTVTVAAGAFEAREAGVGELTATAVPALVDAELNELEPATAVVVVAPAPPAAAMGTFDVTWIGRNATDCGSGKSPRTSRVVSRPGP